jgi:hypothetical protein
VRKSGNLMFFNYSYIVYRWIATEKTTVWREKLLDNKTKKQIDLF